MTKNSIHAHEVLHMMEGNSYSEESLKSAIAHKFGADSLFHTCSAKDLTIDTLVPFLIAKGKFKATVDGFTMDKTKVCKDY